MFAHTIRLQKRAHTEGSKRGKSSPQPRSADPSLREETGGERGKKTTPQLQISSLLADLPRPIISPLRLRALLQRLDLLSNLGLSPPAVSAPAAVRLLCSLDRAERGGQIRAEEVGGGGAGGGVVSAPAARFGEVVPKWSGEHQQATRDRHRVETAARRWLIGAVPHGRGGRAEKTHSTPSEFGCGVCVNL